MSNEDYIEDLLDTYDMGDGDATRRIAKAQVYATLALVEQQKETNDILRKIAEHNFLTYKSPTSQ